MKYEDLAEDLRSQLEEGFFSAVRYSSAADEPNDKVDDAILFAKGTEVGMDDMPGYDKGTVKPWFEFQSRSKSDEEAVRSVKEVLGIYE